MEFKPRILWQGVFNKEVYRLVETSAPVDGLPQAVLEKSSKDAMNQSVWSPTPLLSAMPYGIILQLADALKDATDGWNEAADDLKRSEKFRVAQETENLHLLEEIKHLKEQLIGRAIANGKKPCGCRSRR